MIAAMVISALLFSTFLWSPTSAHAQGQNLAARVNALEAAVAILQQKLECMSKVGTDVIFESCNVHVRSGLGSTKGGEPDGNVNGLGNLIVGYNEPRTFDGAAVKTGSHNLVVGRFHNYSSWGGLVAGELNTVSGDAASVSGGYRSEASGRASSVSGGELNTASGDSASVSGGGENTASASDSSVSGGVRNTATGSSSSVSGGGRNTAAGKFASVSGGFLNTASTEGASVSGGRNNGASGDYSSVSGGNDKDVFGTDGWRAGTLFPEN